MTFSGLSLRPMIIDDYIKMEYFRMGIYGYGAYYVTGLYNYLRFQIYG